MRSLPLRTQSVQRVQTFRRRRLRFDLVERSQSQLRNTGGFVDTTTRARTASKTAIVIIIKMPKTTAVSGSGPTRAKPSGRRRGKKKSRARSIGVCLGSIRRPPAHAAPALNEE
jgi:hypothetical protein